MDNLNYFKIKFDALEECMVFFTNKTLNERFQLFSPRSTLVIQNRSTAPLKDKKISGRIAFEYRSDISFHERFSLYPRVESGSENEVISPHSTFNIQNESTLLKNKITVGVEFENGNDVKFQESCSLLPYLESHIERKVNSPDTTQVIQNGSTPSLNDNKISGKIVFEHGSDIGFIDFNSCSRGESRIARKVVAPEAKNRLKLELMNIHNTRYKVTLSSKFNDQKPTNDLPTSKINGFSNESGSTPILFKDCKSNDLTADCKINKTRNSSHHTEITKFKVEDDQLHVRSHNYGNSKIARNSDDIPKTAELMHKDKCKERSHSYGNSKIARNSDDIPKTVELMHKDKCKERSHSYGISKSKRNSDDHSKILEFKRKDKFKERSRWFSNSESKRNSDNYSKTIKSRHKDDKYEKGSRSHGSSKINRTRSSDHHPETKTYKSEVDKFKERSYRFNNFEVNRNSHFYSKTVEYRKDCKFSKRSDTSKINRTTNSNYRSETVKRRHDEDQSKESFSSLSNSINNRNLYYCSKINECNCNDDKFKKIPSSRYNFKNNRPNTSNDQSETVTCKNEEDKLKKTPYSIGNSKIYRSDNTLKNNRTRYDKLETVECKGKDDKLQGRSLTYATYNFNDNTGNSNNRPKTVECKKTDKPINISSSFGKVPVKRTWEGYVKQENNFYDNDLNYSNTIKPITYSSGTAENVSSNWKLFRNLRKKPTKEELDAELDRYMNERKIKVTTAFPVKKEIDTSVGEYMPEIKKFKSET